jgi:hypothetical protein
VDKLDHQYRYWLRRETEITEKEIPEKVIADKGNTLEDGLRWLEAHRKARRAAMDKCQPLRDLKKFADVKDLRRAHVSRI